MAEHLIELRFEWAETPITGYYANVYCDGAYQATLAWLSPSILNAELIKENPKLGEPWTTAVYALHEALVKRLAEEHGEKVRVQRVYEG